MTEPARWRHVPARPLAPPATASLIGPLTVAWLAVAGPWVRARALPASAPGEILAVGLTATVLTVALARRPWWARLAVAAAATAVLLPSQGETIAVWVGVGLVLGAWVGFDEPPVPGLPRAGSDALAPVVVLGGVALWQGSKASHTWQMYVPLAIAYAIPLLGHATGGALHRAAAWLGRVAGHVVSTVVFTALGAFAVVVPWLVQRPMGRDPLRAQGGWSWRDRRPLQPTRPWADDPESHTAAPSRRRRWRGPAVAVAALVLVAGVVLVRRSDDPPPPAAAALTTDGGQETADQADQPWYAEYREDIAWVLDERVALRPFDVYRVLDVETRHVNVHDNHRDSWTPPPCDCRRVTVWLYGGSAVFGLEQRDEETIASELAKAARADGLTLDVVNRGLPGQMHWRNAFRFAWDLTNDAAPDLVVFYDGADEVASALALRDRGLGDTRAPFEPFVEELYDELFDVPTQPVVPDLVDDVSWPTVSDADPADPGALAVVRYQRARELSAATAATAGIPVRYVWQPTRSARDQAEGVALDADERDRAAAYARAAELLPADVLDLTDVFDGVEGRLFADEVHHGEQGAEVVARALYRSLADQLRVLEEPG